MVQHSSKSTGSKKMLWCALAIVVASSCCLYFALYIDVQDRGAPIATTSQAHSQILSHAKLILSPHNQLPNIIVILSDDHGWDDVGYHNKKYPNINNNSIPTPHIDALVNSLGSIELNYFYAQNMCTMSRGALLTGRYPTHNGLSRMTSLYINRALPKEQWTIAQVLKKYRNYSTYCVGKWHIGSHSFDYTPTFRGFDRFFGFYGSGQHYFTHIRDSRYNMREDIGENCGYNCSRIAFETKGIYAMDLYTDYITHTIFPLHSVKENEDKNRNPFFIYFAMQGVHQPLEAPEHHINLRQNSHITAISKRKTYAGMISDLDECVGNITKQLKKLGLYDNTIILFSADNGSPSMTSPVNIGGRNFPLRGGKKTIYEGGSRVPAFVHIPSMYYKYYANYKNIKYKLGNDNSNSDINKGAVYENPVHITDYFATILDAAKIDRKQIDNIDNDPFLTNPINKENNDGSYHIDGVSHWKSFIYTIHQTVKENTNDHDDKKNDNYNLKAPRKSFYYGLNLGRTRSAIRLGNYKLISWFGHSLHEVTSFYHNETNWHNESLKLYPDGRGLHYASWALPSEYHPKFKGPTPFKGYIDPMTKIAYQLFDVVNDQSETKDISLQNIQLTKKMIQMLDDVEKTFVEDVDVTKLPQCVPLPPYPQNAMGPKCQPLD